MSSPKTEAFLPWILVYAVRCVGRCQEAVLLSCLPVPVFARCTTLFHKSLAHCACACLLYLSRAAFTAPR